MCTPLLPWYRHSSPIPAHGWPCPREPSAPCCSCWVSRRQRRTGSPSPTESPSQCHPARYWQRWHGTPCRHELAGTTTGLAQVLFNNYYMFITLVPFHMCVKVYQADVMQKKYTFFCYLYRVAWPTHRDRGVGLNTVWHGVDICRYADMGYEGVSWWVVF